MVTPNSIGSIEGEEVSFFDPGETFIEASKSHRHCARVENPGMQSFLTDGFIAASARASFRYRSGRTIQLDDPQGVQLCEANLRKLLCGRKTPTAIRSGGASLSDLSWLCWAADGARAEIARGVMGRCAPSAGALYSRELFLSCSENDAQGLWHYDPYTHELQEVSPVEPRTILSATTQSDLVGDAPLVFVVVSVFWRSRLKYGQRAVRFAQIEAGHVAQNLLLAAEAIGMNALPIGGFFDDEVNQSLKLDGLHETAMYLIPMSRTTVNN